MTAFFVVEPAKKLPQGTELCFKHFGAYCIIGTMPGHSVTCATELRAQIQAFLNFCRVEKGLSANSLSAYSSDLARLSTFLGEAASIPGTEDLRAYLDSLYQAGLSSRSVA